MYATCLFCHGRLGSNADVEQFPIGRRLAFDAANGRLWVVCDGCGRWNLSPLEERWEAIETCERMFRAGGASGALASSAAPPMPTVRCRLPRYPPSQE